MNNQFKLKQGLDTNLPAIKDENTLYHTTDTKRTFIGSTELQNKIIKDYTPSSGTGEDLVIVNTDTVEEAFGKIETSINNIDEKISTSASSTNRVTDKLYVDNALSKFSTDHTVRVINMTDSAATIVPNTFYVWGEMTELDITLATPTDTTIYNEYMFQFTSGEIATTLSLPEGITWYLNNSTILANKTYQVSIVNNLAVLGEF